jgi:antirestriction protein ArdC
LVAELGSAFICAKNGFNTYERDDHASYINDWLSALKSDKRMIFKAASLAQKAADFILS